MAGGSARPTICYHCGAVPEYNKQGFASPLWMYRTRTEGNMIIWFTLCPGCCATQAEASR